MLEYVQTKSLQLRQLRFIIHKNDGTQNYDILRKFRYITMFLSVCPLSAMFLC